MNTASIRRGVAATLPALALTLVASAAPAHASSTTTTAERRAELKLVKLINSERRRDGLAPLRVQPRLRDYARHHAADQLGQGDLWHDMDEYERWVPNAATVVGENVGYGDSVDGLHEAYMDSPGHRANILNRDYNYLGVGVQVGANGEMYTSIDFMRCMTRTCR